MSNDPAFDDDRVASEIHRAISLRMGRGREYSVEDVGTGTKIPARTLASYIAAGDNRRTPSGPALLRLMGFFGAEFTTKVLSLVGMGAFYLEPEPNDPAIVIATLVEGASHFARRGADRVYCHNDQGALEPIADEMIATLTPFSSRSR